MEQNVDNIIQVCQYRSYTKNLKMGVATAFRQLGTTIRYLLPSLVLTVLLPLPFILFFLGQNDALLRKWVELGYVPEARFAALKDSIGKCSRRNVPLLLFLLLGVVLFGIAIWLPFLLGISKLWSLLFVFVIFLIDIPFDVVFMEMSYTDKTFGECAGRLAKGMRNYGKLFAFSLLRGMLLLCVGILAFVPLMVALGVSVQAYSAHLDGDVLNLPALFPVIVYLAYAVGMFVSLVAVHVFSFSRCLMWGSLVEEVPADAKVDGEGI